MPQKGDLSKLSFMVESPSQVMFVDIFELAYFFRESMQAIRPEWHEAVNSMLANINYWLPVLAGALSLRLTS